MGDRLFDHPFDPSRALAQLRGDGPALVAAARAAGLDARVPTCPDWSVAELLSNVGQVHGRVASLIAARQTAPPPPEPPRPPTGAALPDWLEEQFDALLTSLRSVQPYTPLWTWYPPEQDAAFWYRRMAHETLVHRADAELAARMPRLSGDRSALNATVGTPGGVAAAVVIGSTHNSVGSITANAARA